MSVFWSDLEEDLADPEFREVFARESSRIGATDRAVNAASSTHEPGSDAPSDSMTGS